VIGATGLISTKLAANLRTRGHSIAKERGVWGALIKKLGITLDSS
jgi:hypothetical protein